VIGLGAGLALAAAAHSAPLPISAFYAPPASRGAQLSPSGRYLALIEHADQHDTVSIVDLQEPHHTKSVALRAKDGQGVHWVRWKDDDRLLAGLGRRHKPGEEPDERDPHAGEVLTALDRDGGRPVTLKAGSDDAKAAQSMRMADALRADPAHVLLIAPDAKGRSSLWKVDVHSGSAEFVGEGKDDPDDEIPGANMVVRYDARHPDRDEVEYDVLGPAPGGHKAYVSLQPRSKADGDVPSLRIYDFDHRTFSDPVWPAMPYEVSDVVYHDGDKALAGVCYTADSYVCDFRNEALNADYRRAQAHFDGPRSLTPLTMSDDGRFWLFGVQGPTEAGAYYVFDRKTKTMTLAADRHPELPSAKLGPMQAITYKARDGMEIHAYLTRPPGAPAGTPLPLVVMPHGGPEARDSLGFDIWAEILATRGYMVLQPNFRGSAGYGRKFTEAGYGQWGGKMQNDITDGVMQLIRSGQADPNRICIFGASFGGYAALYGAAQSPGLYKCAASFAGVADLRALVQWEHATKGHEERYAYAERSIGDPDRDGGKLKAVSPLTYVAKYKVPVLLIHGTEDRSVPVEQSQMMDQALRAAHKDVRLVVFPGEGHTDWSPRDEQTALAEVAGFIEGHIAAAPSGTDR
jgi:dipeptidyl aminopeptidase/acylaminoacyl peptidase